MSRKVGDTLEFLFAGSTHIAKIIEIEKKGNKILSYKLNDGKYTYTITKEQIL
jgi:hypothetical protein